MFKQFCAALILFALPACGDPGLVEITNRPSVALALSVVGAFSGFEGRVFAVSPADQLELCGEPAPCVYRSSYGQYIFLTPGTEYHYCFGVFRAVFGENFRNFFGVLLDTATVADSWCRQFNMETHDNE